MVEDLREKALSGMVWTGGERFLFEAVHFLIWIVFARLLTPADYGIVGMLSIFTLVATIFLDCGFSSALIQKKNLTDDDFSTAFHFNMALAVAFYFVLFFCAPWIAAFYETPVLVQVTRVIALSLIINGLTIVQTAKLSVALNFKSQAIASFVALLFSGTLGIWLACHRYGYWAIVWQGLTLAAIRAMILWGFSRWIPQWRFSRDSFRKLFSFGFKLLCTELIDTIYGNIYPMVIGKFFGAMEIGYFNRANQFAILPADTVSGIVVKVNYPILVTVREDHDKLLKAYRKLIRAPLFFLFPVLWGMAAVAHPLVLVLLGEQWLPCVPLLQVLCIGAVCTLLTQVNLNLLYVKGRSDLVLKLEFIKKPIAFVILIGSLFFPAFLDSVAPAFQQRLFSWTPLGPVSPGVFWIAVGWALYEVLAFPLSCCYTRRLLQYGFCRQVRELLPLLVRTALMALSVFVVVRSFVSPFLQLGMGVFVGISVYLLLSLVAHDETLAALWHEIRARGRR